MCFSILQARVTGSTLNGRKEQLQAEEGDKEKWDFLQFAEAWTPTECAEELQKDVLFTHVRFNFLSISVSLITETVSLSYIILSKNSQLFILIK